MDIKRAFVIFIFGRTCFLQLLFRAEDNAVNTSLGAEGQSQQPLIASNKVRPKINITKQALVFLISIKNSCFSC